jgi:hypothetical protein
MLTILHFKASDRRAGNVGSCLSSPGFIHFVYCHKQQTNSGESEQYGRSTWGFLPKSEKITKRGFRILKSLSLTEDEPDFLKDSQRPPLNSNGTAGGKENQNDGRRSFQKRANIKFKSWWLERMATASTPLHEK